jgi:RNA polymerase sigma-70 factor (ECF subfamily)
LSPELSSAIEQAADRLPRRHREIFLLKDVEGLSYAQIANITGASLPAVKEHLHLARLSLRESIDRFCTGGELAS